MADATLTERITEEITEILVEQFGVKEALIGPDARFGDDLGLDSLDGLEMVMMFEEKFKTTIPDGVAAKIVTVADAINTVMASLPEGDLE